MRILIIHNRYRYSGGEDVVVDSEADLLRSKGHEVFLFTKDNEQVHGLPGAINSIWSSSARQELKETIRQFRPEVAHVHNVFHALSPGIYSLLSASRIPVVQTLHNFRLFCIRGTFEREGGVCERCAGGSLWPGVLHKCYRGSFGASAVLAANLEIHRMLNTFADRVNEFIVLNEFCRNKFIQCGLPESKLTVKPNFIDIDDVSEKADRRGGLYVGRLSEEKGVGILAKAMERVDIELTAIGSGPAAGLLRTAKGVKPLDAVPREDVFTSMRHAEFLVMPSVWYETFGLVMIEAFANRLPVIASDIGAMAELVEDGKTGLLFKAGSVEDLAEKLRWAQAHPQEMRAMGDAARSRYEADFTSRSNYDALLGIYAKAAAGRDPKPGSMR